MTIEVSTRQYEFTHGRKPSNYSGPGSWAFILDGQDDLAQLFWAHQATYGQAKRAAIAEARRRGFRRVEVAT